MAKSKRKDGLKVRTFKYEGKRYYIYGRTNKELTEKEMKKRAELEAGTNERVNPTLNKYYEHFTEMRRGSVRESTIRSQRYQFEDAAGVVIDGNNKTLGELQIRDITPKDMQYVQIALAKTERTTETVNNIMAHVKHVFNAAVRDETIDRNPCNCIIKLRRKEKPARETIHRALTQEETEKFFEAARKRNSFYYNLFAVMVQTGMRVGEVGALTVFDVDEVSRVIHVRRTITRDEASAYVIGDMTKTEAGRRDLRMSEIGSIAYEGAKEQGTDVFEVIRNQRNMNRLLFGANLPETIFTSPEGALLRDYTVDREIARCCKAAGIDRITSHAFRSTFITRAIEQQPGSYKVISEFVGHSTCNITLNVYAHNSPERIREVMNNVVIKLG